MQEEFHPGWYFPFWQQHLMLVLLCCLCVGWPYESPFHGKNTFYRWQEPLAVSPRCGRRLAGFQLFLPYVCWTSLCTRKTSTTPNHLRRPKHDSLGLLLSTISIVLYQHVNVKQVVLWEGWWGRRSRRDWDELACRGVPYNYCIGLNLKSAVYAFGIQEFSITCVTYYSV